MDQSSSSKEEVDRRIQKMIDDSLEHTGPHTRPLTEKEIRKSRKERRKYLRYIDYQDYDG